MLKHTSTQRKRFLALLACSCSLFAAATASANEPAGELDEFGLDTIVVTATRTPLAEKKIPQSVQVITAEDIKRLGAENVTAALKLAQNINIAKSDMTGNTVIMRGMNTNHVLILTDGRRIAGEDTSATQNVYALNRINVDSIERIEIVRGSASSIYGSDAMAGVINIITKQPEKKSATIGVSTGSDEINNYYRFDSGKQGRWSASLDARFSEVRKTTHRDKTAAGTITTSGDNSNMYGPKQYFNFDAVYDFENNNENKLRFNLNYLKENLSSDYADSYMTKTPSMYTSKNKKEWYYNDGYGFSMDYTGKTAKNDYQIRSYYNKFKKESRLFNNRASFGMMENTLGSMYPKRDFDNAEYYTWVTEARNTTKLSDKHNLTYGGEYRRVNYEGTRLGDGADNVSSVTVNGVTKNSSEKTINSYAFYLQDEWEVSDKLFLVPSVRWDHDNSFGSEITPKIGLSYALSSNSRLKANVGKGYKAPTISELYMHMHRAMGSTTIDVYGNPNLQPEESTNYDISFEAERNNTFGKVTYFQNRVKNLITTEALKPSGTENRYVNVDKAQINGVELEGGHHLNKYLTIKATYNWLDATDKTDGSRLNNRARNNATLQFIYNDNKPNPFTATLWNEWNYDYRYNNADYDYSTTNFVVTKKWNKTFSTYAGLDNIFNKKVNDLYIDGRLWRIGMEMTF